MLVTEPTDDFARRLKAPPADEGPRTLLRTPGTIAYEGVIEGVPHRLMLRSLTLMRSLSPDYLGRFLAQMDALLWLDQVNQHTSLKDNKTKRQARVKK